MTSKQREVKIKHRKARNKKKADVSASKKKAKKAKK